MPVLTNHQHERFAQARARGLDGKTSAVEAGYAEAGARVRACELNKRPDVTARIEELRAAANETIKAAVAVDRQWVLRELVANYHRAVERKDGTSANRALELVGKEIGMFIDRKMDMASPLANLTAPQLEALARFAEQMARRQSSATAAGTDAAAASPELDPGSDKVH